MAVAGDKERDLLRPARRDFWRLPPQGFPPWQTAYRWFARLRDEAAYERVNHAPVMEDRQRVGRKR